MTDPDVEQPGVRHVARQLGRDRGVDAEPARRERLGIDTHDRGQLAGIPDQQDVVRGA